MEVYIIKEIDNDTAYEKVYKEFSPMYKKLNELEKQYKIELIWIKVDSNLLPKNVTII